MPPRSCPGDPGTQEIASLKGLASLKLKGATNIAHENPIFPDKIPSNIYQNGGFYMAMLVSGSVLTSGFPYGGCGIGEIGTLRLP